MPTQKLTATVIKNLPKPDKRTDYRDEATRGLYLRVFPSGQKTWRLRYVFRQKEKYLKLGEWPTMSLADARRTVMDQRELLAEGRDPDAESQRIKVERDRMPTVAEFADEYIERHAKPNKKSWRSDRRNLDVDVLPFIGKVALDDLHRRDIVAVIDRIRDRGADTHANRVFAVVRKMLNFAVERGVIDVSPALQIKQSKERRRDVVLSDGDLQLLWAATEPYGETETALPMHHNTRLILRLLLTTAARNAEVCGIRLDELDLDRERWVLPARRSKNDQGHTIPLSNLAMKTIRAALETADGTFLFPSNSKCGHVTIYAPIQAMQRLFDSARKPHDLRRTAASRMTELGHGRLVVDKILNHVDGSVGAVYDRYSYYEEKRAALNDWSAALAKLVS